MRLKRRFIADINRTVDDDILRRQILLRWMIKILILFVGILAIVNICLTHYVNVAVNIGIAVIFFGMYWIVYWRKEKGILIVSLVMVAVMIIAVNILLLYEDTNGTVAIWLVIIPPLTILVTGVEIGAVSSTIILIEMMCLFWTPFGRNALAHSYGNHILLSVQIIYVLLMFITLFFEEMRINTYNALRESRRMIQETYKHQYDSLQNKIADAKKIRHDMRHHYVVMQTYIKEKNFEGLSEYIESLNNSLPFEESMMYCECYGINALLTYFGQQCREYGIQCSARVNYPKDIPFSDVDINVIFGNILENAVEECLRCKIENPDGEVQIDVTGNYEDGYLVFCTENTTCHELQKKNDVFLSSKRNGYGTGVESVKAIVRKYNGVAEFGIQNGKFVALISMSV